MHTCRKEMMRIQCPLPPHRRRVLLHPLSGRRALPWHHFSFDNLLTFQTNDRVKEGGGERGISLLSAGPGLETTVNVCH